MKNMQRVLRDYDAPKQTVRQLPAKAFATFCFLELSGKKETLRRGGFEWCRPCRAARRDGRRERSVRDMNTGKDERFHGYREYFQGPLLLLFAIPCWRIGEGRL
ncbi:MULTISPECIES: hypothetical protein [Agrobacterium tumefaciens complex]|uniref:Uncharacterized protein n=1 Tax=Agrobacterium radiobacter TaxID=362 RepID=A0ABD5LNH1_AGRRD|nr:MULTISPECIES: hypothetical protein [Agrobacterium tumefaciens complex]NIB12149.1 hypothetical protein [Agrobacterium radiobacter]